MPTDADEDLLNAIEKNLDFGHNTRGQFLSKLAHVEVRVDMVITRHLISDEKRSREFTDLFLNDRLMLGRKIEILERILKNNYDDFRKSNPEFISKLKALKEFRNNLAHGIGVWFGDEKTATERFNLMTRKKGIVTITNKHVIAMEKDAHEVENILSHLRLIIEAARSSNKPPR